MNPIKSYLPFPPTEQQTLTAQALEAFLARPAMPGEPRAFMLKGYAGTGKTSLVGALVKALREANVPVELMSPTGRAAKVFAAMAGTPAWTIHRRIYRQPAPGDPDGSMTLAPNTQHGAVFIVDEASMIGDEEEWGDDGPGRPGLLPDLLEWVFGQEAEGTRLILVGDSAQLPPVGLADSPALQPDVLRRWGISVTRATLTQTVRQAADSGILYNATRLRRQLRQLALAEPGAPLPEPRFKVSGFYPDVAAVESFDLLDEISSAYANDGPEQTLLITRANWSAAEANKAIRAGVLGCEEELVRGERLMVAKNNYLWAAQAGNRKLDFIANGDMATVEEIHAVTELHGMRFADVTLFFADRDASLRCNIMLDSLSAPSPALPAELRTHLRNERLRDVLASETGVDPKEIYSIDPAAVPRSVWRKLRTDPWLNALQVKYAYAVTCHKAQGGQWRNVFVDLSVCSAAAMSREGSRRDTDLFESRPEPTPAEARRELLRWLYTAVTRATHRLLLVNAPDQILT